MLIYRDGSLFTRIISSYVFIPLVYLSFCSLGPSCSLYRLCGVSLVFMSVLEDLGNCDVLTHIQIPSLFWICAERFIGALSGLSSGDNCF